MCELPCAHRALSFRDVIAEVRAAQRSKGLKHPAGKS